MSNMSYCRFENTLSALHDCHANVEYGEDLNTYETAARKALLLLCAQIAEENVTEIDKLKEGEGL